MLGLGLGGTLQLGERKTWEKLRNKVAGPSAGV